jgi:hypothetical protein
MAAKTTQSANDFLNYMARNVAPSWGSATTLYLALQTGAVGLGGDQQTNEVAYTGYARVPVLRNNVTGEFAVAASGQTQNQNLLQFGNPTAGSFPITATHCSLGENASGASTAIFTGSLASPLIINLNVQPQFAIGTLVLKEQ